jgi:PAS domain S-box-containing protein
MKDDAWTALIASDSPGERAALREDLSRDPAARFTVAEAENGVQALDYIRSRNPDCLILSLDLPDLSGLEVIERLGAGEESPGCAIVALVNPGDAQQAIRAMKLGAHDCLERGREMGAALRDAASLAIAKAERRLGAVSGEREMAENARGFEDRPAELRQETRQDGRIERAMWEDVYGGVPGAADENRDAVGRDGRIEGRLRLLEAAIEQSSESVLITSAQLEYPGPQIVYVNSEFTRMTGYTAEEVIGKTPRILQGPKTDRSVLDRLREDCMAARTFHGVTVNYRKDGSEFCLEWSVGPVRDARGNLTHFVATQRDVTVRRRIEAELRENETQLRAILDNSAAVIFVKDLSGRYLRVNRWYERIFSLTEAELKGKTDHDLHCKAVADVFCANDRKVIEADGPLQFDENVPFPDGLRQFVSIKFPLRDAGGLPYAICGIATDITERKQAAAALQESKERLQLALESADVGTWRVDLKTGMDTRDAALNRIIGLPEEPLTVPVEQWFKHIHPDDLGGIIESWDRAMRTGLYNVEHRLVRKDGTAIWARDRGRVFYSDAGEPLYATGAVTDITERKHAEEALRKSAEEIRDLYNHAPCGYHSIDRDGVFVRINDTELSWLGYTREEVVGKIKFADLLTPEGVITFGESFPQLMEKGTVQDVEFDLLTKGGGVIPVLLSATAVTDGAGNFLMSRSVVYNITERKQAEAEREGLLARERTARAEAEQAAERVRRLQTIADSALAHHTHDFLMREMLKRIVELFNADSAVILLLAEDGRDLVVRAAIGLEEEEEQRMRIPFGRGVAGSIAANRASRIIDDLREVDVFSPVLLEKIRSLMGAPLIVEGRVVGVIHTGTVRPRRFTEDDVSLLQLAADRIAVALEHARLYEVEQGARRQAEEANRMKDEFLALVSHELRSPLNAMLGYAALLRRSGLDPQKAGQALEVIERSGKAQAQLIDDLLDTARIITGKLRLLVGPVDLRAVIEESIQTVRPSADAKGLAFSSELPPAAVQITGDASRLQQVVWNLLSNAVKFTPKGGRVKLRLERTGPLVRVSVSDTGKGISPDFQPYVFDRFRQADASSARRYGGLGLGLALVKSLVELHGGTVEVASEGEGKGATFTVALPARVSFSPRGRQAGNPSALAPSGELEGVRALVVGEGEDAREIIMFALTRFGAEVVAVKNEAEAFNALTERPVKERFDVVVSDIGGTKQDGYDLLKRIREWERENGGFLPAVALTACGRAEDRVRALRAGFQSHIAKPVDPAELAALVASVIARPKSGERR